MHIKGRRTICLAMNNHAVAVASSVIESAVLVALTVYISRPILQAALGLASAIHLWGTAQVWDNNLWNIVAFICAQEYECLVLLVGMWALNEGCIWKSTGLVALMVARLKSPLIPHAYSLVEEIHAHRQPALQGD